MWTGALLPDLRMYVTGWERDLMGERASENFADPSPILQSGKSAKLCLTV